MKSAWIMAVFTILTASQYTLNAIELSQTVRELLRFAVVVSCAIVLVKLVSGQPAVPRTGNAPTKP
jgi:hypothetical protein